MAYNLAQKVSGSSKTTITDMRNALDTIDTLSLCNIHATDSVSIDLYYTSQVTTDITSTTVLAAETEAASGSSVTLTVDTVAATADAFVDEKVYKSDGTLFGTCTARNSATELVFGDGLSSAITDNDVLHTGTRYYILKGITLPVNATLVLEKNELRVDSITYTVYIKLSASDSEVDVTTRV